MSFRVGIDVGGTFTDFLVVDAAGEPHIFKTLSTPRDPSEGVFDGFRQMAAALGLGLRDLLAGVSVIVHGTTVTTNALLTGNGVKTGLITTRGFRDVLEMRRGVRDQIYNNRCSPPAPLVPRHLRLPATERVNYAGQAEVALAEADVRAAVAQLAEAGVAAVAISFLHSFQNPGHERQAAALVRELLPAAYLSVSAEVLPEVRFYERTSTTVLNAYVGPILSGYLASLARRLADSGFGGTLLIMQSNGGVVTPEVSVGKAVNTLLSGPAAGPSAGQFFCQSLGLQDLMTIDMGGTSFDVCLVKGGRAITTREGEVAGYRAATPMIDIHTIGAGGGSIAWIDSGGLLRVGPQSAGSDPGPACYGLGGVHPTVTDADTVLGYLNPVYFLGGHMPLHPDRAEEALGGLARRLHLSVPAVAAGIYDIVNASMAYAMQVVSVRRGYDPREFALVVAGGAGGLHAAALAEELEIPLVVVPSQASVFCAAGMLLTDFQHDFVRTHKTTLDGADWSAVQALFAELEAEALATLAREGVAANRVALERSLDLSYTGQFHEVELPCSTDQLTGDGAAALAAGFHAAHDRLFGYSEPDARIQVVNLRLVARGRVDRPGVRPRQAGGGGAVAPKGTRPVYFKAAGGHVETPIYDAAAFAAHQTITGPAVVEAATTAIVVPPGFAFAADAHENFLLYRQGESLAQIVQRLTGGVAVQA